MTRSSRPSITALFALVAAAACTGSTRAHAPPGGGTAPPAPPAMPFTEADVHFMSGMIPHHAQAVLIAGWAAERTARHDVRVLSERIIVAQRDEIELMRNWLRDRGQPVPAADATHLRMNVDGTEHDMLMPGMLNDEELATLERARGEEFDRLFLTYMIRHHDGALIMVERLFGSYGAAQDEEVFRFASDVFADQSTEIDRMEKMLADRGPDGGG